ncbi:hypothetical protein QG053_10680, partial [Kingella kingae]|uniref:hypothetical protein n=1 Tax=Kingella kingae TaxID=504 RepID=UPI00254F4EB1
KEQAYDLLLSAVAETNNEELEDILPEISSADSARAEMIAQYGYDITVWQNQEMSDPDVDAFSLLPPMVVEANEDERLNGDTSNDGLNTFEGN